MVVCCDTDEKKGGSQDRPQVGPIVGDTSESNKGLTQQCKHTNQD